MKKYLSILTALLLALMLAVAPALAETAESPEATEAVEATAPAEEPAADATAAGEAAASEAPADEAAAGETASDETAADETAADDAAGEEAEEEAEEPASWFEEAFGDFTSVHWYTAVILIVLLVLGIVVCRKQKENWTTMRLAFAAMCIAISFVLSMIKLFHMPQGGSVTPASMLPMVMFALACGPAQGIVAGCAYGLLQLIEDFYVIHPLQLLVDYPLAFAAVALCCLVNVMPIKNVRVKLIVAVLLGYLGRYIMATISGAVFFADSAGEQNAWIYSLGYNITYLGVEAVISAVIVAIIPGFDRLVETMRKAVAKR